MDCIFCCWFLTFHHILRKNYFINIFLQCLSLYFDISYNFDEYVLFLMRLYFSIFYNFHFLKYLSLLSPRLWIFFCVLSYNFQVCFQNRIFFLYNVIEGSAFPLRITNCSSMVFWVIGKFSYMQDYFWTFVVFIWSISHSLLQDHTLMFTGWLQVFISASIVVPCGTTSDLSQHLTFCSYIISQNQLVKSHKTCCWHFD